MSGIRSVETLAPIYFESGRAILEKFLLPVLTQSISYDRVTGYFTLEALLAVSQGLDSLYVRDGCMRLAVGIHDFPRDAAQAVTAADAMSRRIEALRDELRAGIAKLSDVLQKDRLATLALMIQDGFLQVKAVDTTSGEGIFHSKMLIMKDESGDSVAAMGSINETASGLGENIENLVVLRSWNEPESVRMQKLVFEDTWQGRRADLIVQELTDELAQDIIEGLGADYINRVRLRLKLRADMRDAAKMPSYYFVSGVIPALYQHQERAVIDGLGRWPIRVLYSDEVGLGKTYEVAATIAFLVRFCGAKRAVVLTPKSVLSQWQDELVDGFGIEAWRYDSAAHAFISPLGVSKSISDNCPLGKDMPPVALISAQYARGSSSQADIFSRPGTILPDVLAVDEAHAARVSKDLSGKTKSTRLFRVLERIASEIPHLILATATPMQKDAVEYHSLLRLLGLPGSWTREKAFELSLSVVSSSEPPSLNDLGQAATLLLQVVKDMHPSFELLSDGEKDFMDELLELDGPLALGSLAQKHWGDFRRVFIKLHPARLLTVRNTRRSLEEVGYVFPHRNLTAKTLNGYPDILQFYDEINRYIGSTYLGVEKVLYPDRKFSDGFVKSSYQQRMASSLYSCGKSLARRRERLEALRELVRKKEQAQWTVSLDLSDEDLDDAFLSDSVDDEFESILNEAPASQVLLALNAEIADISPLINRLHNLRQQAGDPKVDTAIELVLEHLERDSQVLIFSRYTDTIDALLARWTKSSGGMLTYGVYTGSQATIYQHGEARPTTKEEIKNLLNAHKLKVVFCSDAASEGLNLQAARVLVNVDVPWTPARLEQRIGRIARLGQKATSVDIINVWYPQSVEQRMYTRINQRLRRYNLAVGEFPEVVADSIRRSILEGSTDKSIEMLQAMRNSIQTRALMALWEHGSEQRTASQAFRQKLIDSLARINSSKRIDAQTLVVTLPDGSMENVSAYEGDSDTVSLSRECILEYFPTIQGYMTAYDRDGRCCAFATSEAILNPERLPDLLGGTTDFTSLELHGRPRWLPNPDALSLRYAVEHEVGSPYLWPPVIGESE